MDDIHIIDGSSFNFLTNISTGHNKVYDLDFRFDSNRLLTCGDDSRTRIWNTSNITNISSLVIMDEVINNDKGYTC
jgi:WD40 repeat protein